MRAARISSHSLHEEQVSHDSSKDKSIMADSLGAMGEERAQLLRREPGGKRGEQSRERLRSESSDAVHRRPMPCLAAKYELHGHWLVATVLCIIRLLKAAGC